MKNKEEFEEASYIENKLEKTLQGMVNQHLTDEYNKLYRRYSQA